MFYQFVLLSLTLSFTTASATIPPLMIAGPCEESLFNRQGQRTLRDLQVQAFVESITRDRQLSERALARFFASVESFDFFDKRSELVRLLVERPEILRAAEIAIEKTRASTVLVADSVAANRARAEEVLEVYGEFSGVTTAIAACFGFVPVAFVTAIHSVVKGTTEHRLVQRGRSWFNRANRVHEFFTGEGVVAGLGYRIAESLRRGQSRLPLPLQGLTGQLAAASVEFASAAADGGKRLFTAGRELTDQTLREAREQIRDFAAELEISTMLAQLALQWRSQGLPTTRMDWKNSAEPFFEVVNGSHAALVSRGPFRPYSLNTGNVDGHPKTLLVTGPHSSGKSSLLEAVTWFHTLGRIGGYLPAERVAAAKSYLLTSLAGGAVDRANNQGLADRQIQELKELIELATTADLPTVIVVDEVASGLRSDLRRQAVAQFRSRLAQSATLLMLATNDPIVAEDLRFSSTPILTRWSSDAPLENVLKAGAVYSPEGSQTQSFF